MSRSDQKIIPHLWFDHQAEEAVRFYTSLFAGSSAGAMTRYRKEGFEIHGQPEGRVMTIDFELGGYKLIALNGGPFFSFTPAISFFVICETEREIDALWQQLSEGGTPLMALDKYAWSDKYGWTQDRYGLSWQLMLGKIADAGQKISPSLMYVGQQHGKAEEAMQFYTSIFKNSSIAEIVRYEAQDGDTPGTVKHARFTLEDETFMAMDSGFDHRFNFTEAISFLVTCTSQDEVDYFWNRLSQGGDPAAQQCGWLKDKFGVSWQVTPTELATMIQDPDPQKVGRVTNAFLKMKKLDIATLRRAYEGQ
jgi:predicted 3-demethylubiquinone-9 3-methyltransferase (glyoxalase superfamily)